MLLTLDGSISIISIPFHFKGNLNNLPYSMSK